MQAPMMTMNGVTPSQLVPQNMTPQKPRRRTTNSPDSGLDGQDGHCGPRGRPAPSNVNGVAVIHGNAAPLVLTPRHSCCATRADSHFILL